MEDDKKKRSIRKKIMAIISSFFLVFSNSGIGSSASVVPDPSLPKAESNMGAQEMKNYYDLVKHYPDIKQTAEEVISLDEILALNINGDICETMVPQGLAIKDGLILVTAYDGIEGYRRELSFYSYKKENRDKLEKEKNHEIHNSAIVVIDQETKKIITTIELPDINHVGGIALDENNAYIAKSLDKVISVISFEKIKTAAQEGKQKGIKECKTDYDYELECDCDASFVSIRNKEDGKNQLVVGTWNPLPNSSTIRIFDFDENQKLKLNQKFNINSSCNGATFLKRDNKEYLIVACSIGRVFNSSLFVYEVEEDRNGKLLLTPKSHSELPPMAEELTEFETADGKRKLAISSEAFSKRYEIGRSSVISEGIIISDLNAILDKKEKDSTKDAQKPFDIYKFDDIENEEDEEKKRRRKKEEYIK